MASDLDAASTVAHVSGLRQKHEQVSATFSDAARAVSNLDDALAVAIDRSTGEGKDAGPLGTLKDRLTVFQEPIVHLLSELEDLRQSLDPLATISESVAQQQRVQLERERVLKAANEALEDTRAKLDSDQAAFERLRRDHEQEVLENKLLSNADNESGQLRSILRDVRAQLRDAQESAAARNRLLEKRGVQLGDLRMQMEQMQGDNERLQDELRKASRVNARTGDHAKETIARLQQELTASRHREMRAQEMLIAETRKQNALQHTLQQELSSRETTSSSLLPSLEPHRRAISAQPGDTGAATVDVIRTLRRNQALINEITDRRVENERLRQDNAALLLHAKDAHSETAGLRNQVVTSGADREELIRRLRKSEADARRWKEQLNVMARKATQRHFEQRVAKEEDEWGVIDTLAGMSMRRSSSGSLRAPSRSRNIQVERWGNYNKVEL